MFPILSHDTDSLHSMTRCLPFPENLRQHPNRKLHPKKIGWNSKCERKGTGGFYWSYYHFATRSRETYPLRPPAWAFPKSRTLDRSMFLGCGKPSSPPQSATSCPQKKSVWVVRASGRPEGPRWEGPGIRNCETSTGRGEMPCVMYFQVSFVSIISDITSDISTRLR